MRARATLSLLLCAVLLAAASVGARAAEDPWQKTVKMDITGMTLNAVVASLLKNTGLNFTIDRNIGEAKMPRLTFKDVPMRTAFEDAVWSVGAVYWIDNGVLVTISAEPDPWFRRVKLEFKDIKLADAVDKLLKGTGIEYAMDPDTQDLRVDQFSSGRGTQRLAAFELTLRAGRATYRVENGVYKISRDPLRGGEWEKSVFLDVTGKELRSEVEQLIKNTGVNFVIDADIGEAKIESLFFKDVPMYVAFRNLLKSMGAVYRVEGGAILIQATRNRR